jgi:pimeloyl-ACP methyl ester carboxylesterase
MNITVNSNNTTLPLLLHNPHHAQNKIVVFCHGFPGSNRLHNLHKPLDEHGYAIAEVIYSGDKESQGKFSFIGVIQNIIDSVKILKQKFPKAKYTALGFSYGGFAIANIVHKEPRLFDKVCLLNPLIDTLFLTKNSQMQELLTEANDAIKLQDINFHKNEFAIIQKDYHPPNLTLPKFTLIQSTHDEILSPKVSHDFCKEKNGHYVEIENGTHVVNGDEKVLIEAIVD